MRDDAVLEAIRARLRAAGLFHAILRGTPDESPPPGDLSVRAVAWVAWTGATEAMDDTSAAGPNYLRTCEFQVWVEGRAEDQVGRIRLMARLDSVVRNAVLGPGADPPWFSLSFGRAVPVTDISPPAARSILPGEALYSITTPMGRDESTEV